MISIFINLLFDKIIFCPIKTIQSNSLRPIIKLSTYHLLKSIPGISSITSIKECLRLLHVLFNLFNLVCLVWRFKRTCHLSRTSKLKLRSLLSSFVLLIKKIRWRLSFQIILLSWSIKCWVTICITTRQQLLLSSCRINCN
jgi:hypothetical protein